RVDALQLRLKKLNYYDGPVDGYYGKSTEKAVKLFQKKLGLNVTGTASVRTQTLLFSKDAPEYVKPTVIGVPVITVERYDSVQNGVYYINDSSAPGGYAVFNWYVEGEVKNFNVKVYDADGRVLVNEKTLLSRTGVPLSTLEKNRLYALTVTAYPEDGNRKHVTTESVGFIHCENRPPEVQPMGVVGDPQLFIKTVLRTQGGVQYVQPGEVAFHWHADGELDRYCVEIFSSDGEMLKALETRGEQLSLPTSGLSVGKVYTLYVYAIPARGNIENARTAAQTFALEDLSIPTPTPEPEEPDVTPEPLVTASPTPEPPASEEPPAEDGALPEVVAELPGAASDAAPEEVAEPVPEEVPEPVPEEIPEPVPEEITEPVPEEVAEPVPEEVAEPVPEEVAELIPEEVAEPEPVEIPEVEAPEVVGETAPEAVTPPVLSFETTVEQLDEITYVADDILVMHWQSEGDVRAYYAEVVNDEGEVLASATTEDTSIAVRQGNLTEGEVYTLNVTALPADDSAGQTASAQFALYHEDAAEAPPVEEPIVEEPVIEEPVVEEPIVEEPIVEEPVI
ncbi:MAG: peptidoglycan-binding protein, partial [Clostridia bacterium]|nr:peptidoglycan-binding protein [Clostridia bacterium]